MQALIFVLNVCSESSVCEKVFVVPDKAYGDSERINGIFLFVLCIYDFLAQNILYTDVLLYDTIIK
jgi:hypothetical protein